MRQPWFPFLSFFTMANAGGAVRAHWTFIAAKRTGDLSRLTLATAWLLLACVCGQFAGLTQIIGYTLDKVGAKLVQSVKSQDMTSSAWPPREVGGKSYPNRTKPGGHFKEISDYKKGLRNRLDEFKQDCWDDDDCDDPPKIPVWVWEIDKRPIPAPVDSLSPIENWVNSIGVSDQTLNRAANGALLTAGAAAIVATGGTATPLVKLVLTVGGTSLILQGR